MTDTTNDRTIEIIRKGQPQTLYKSAVQACIDERIEKRIEASNWTLDRAEVTANFLKNSPDGAMLYDALTRARPDPKPENVEPPQSVFDSTVGKIAKQMAEKTGCTPATATAELLKAAPHLYDEYLADHPHQTGADTMPSSAEASLEKHDARQDARETVREVVRKLRRD